MAHQLETFEDGKVAFVSREEAWHQLGTITKKAFTAEEALEIAQLDSQVIVSQNPVQVVVDGEILTIEDKFATYREHAKYGRKGLGVVGSRYVPIQNADAFSFLNNLVDQSGAIFETAGSIRGGRQVFMSLQMPQEMKLANGIDAHKMFIMATNSHDGSQSFNIAVTPVRVVCTNTVRMGLRNAVSKISLRHTASATGKVAQAKEVLGLVHAYQDEFAQEVDRLVDQTFTDIQFEKLVSDLFPITDDFQASGITKTNNKRDELLSLWTAPTQANIAGTKWAAYNAVAEYADWFAPVRGKNPDKARAERILMGTTDELKEKALTLLG